MAISKIFIHLKYILNNAGNKLITKKTKTPHGFTVHHFTIHLGTNHYEL